MSNITNCGSNKTDIFDIDTIDGIYGFLAETFKQNGFSSLEFSLLEKLKSQCKKEDEVRGE